jgi:hypothetical protein
MIFGFNTDIKAQQTVYHVQTEVREQERRLESQVFVSGRCIGKRSKQLSPEADEASIQELARGQHRLVVDAVREGYIEEAISQEVVEELTIHFLGSQRSFGGNVLLRFRVLSGGFIAPCVEVTANWKSEGVSGEAVVTTTNDAGVAEMRMELADGAAELEVRASLEGREAMRRFLIKTAKA